ncbi:MAG: hypothetical protein MMC33_002761 [Icmadophila ericetorum]|nr:hypothetical protein [Icmadophila ericetorum]
MALDILYSLSVAVSGANTKNPEIKMLLFEKARIWSKVTSPDAMLFTKEEPTHADLDTFRMLFTAEFPLHPDGPSDPTFGKEIDGFFQGPNESIFQYYTRAGQFLHSFGPDDGLTSNTKLPPRHAALVRIDMDAIARGIWN